MILIIIYLFPEFPSTPIVPLGTCYGPRHTPIRFQRLYIGTYVPLTSLLS